MMNRILFRKEIVALLLVLFLTHKISLGQSPPEGSNFSKTDTATVPKEIEDPENIGINKELNHTTLIPYGNLAEALKAKRSASSLAISLNGFWNVIWVEWAPKRPG
jgi:beta-galactosidase